MSGPVLTSCSGRNRMRAASCLDDGLAAAEVSDCEDLGAEWEPTFRSPVSVSTEETDNEV